MKLINKAAKKIVKPNIGDAVHLEMFYNDGRAIESYVVKASVVKVNRVTFDAKTEDGNVYRIKFNDPQIVGYKRKEREQNDDRNDDRPSRLDYLMNTR
jgi:hypothetical protein